MLDDLRTALSEKLSLKTPGTLDNTWKNFRNTVYKTLNKMQGTVGRKHEDWFDEHSIELQDLLSERNLARFAAINRLIRKTKERYKEYNRAL